MEVEGQGTEFQSEESDIEEGNKSLDEEDMSTEDEEVFVRHSTNNNATVDQRGDRVDNGEGNSSANRGLRMCDGESDQGKTPIDPEEEAYFNRLHFYLMKQGVIPDQKSQPSESSGKVEEKGNEGSGWNKRSHENKFLEVN